MIKTNYEIKAFVVFKNIITSYRAVNSNTFALHFSAKPIADSEAHMSDIRKVLASSSYDKRDVNDILSDIRLPTLPGYSQARPSHRPDSENSSNSFICSVRNTCIYKL